MSRETLKPDSRPSARSPFTGLRPAAAPPELRARALGAARRAHRRASSAEPGAPGPLGVLGRLVDRLWESRLLAPSWAAAALLLAVLGLARPWAPAPGASLQASAAPERPTVVAELGDVPPLGLGLAPSAPSETWSREALRPYPPGV